MSNIYKINNEKFKGISISYNLTLPIVKEKIAENSVLASVLSKGSKNYPNQNEIDRFLSWHYGSNFETSVEKIGDLYNIEFKFLILNKKYLPNNEDVLDNCLRFMNDIIYNPLVNTSKFDSFIVKREKEYIRDKINEKKDDKLRYAVQKTEELLCDKEPFGVFVYGREEDLENITEESLYRRYIEVLDESMVTVIISGNLTGYDDIDNKIEEVFGSKLNSRISCNDLIINNVNDSYNENIQYFEEKVESTQSVLTMGLKVKDINEDEVFPLIVYNAILGDTPSSKLFQNFREKESLAYTVRSRYYRYKNMFVIYAGIDKINYNRAIEVIKGELNSIKNGNINEEEFIASKQSIVADLLEWYDSKVALQKMLLSNLLNYKNTDMNLEDIISKIEKVTISDIIEVSKKVEINLIYFLGGEKSV
ncbi:MAG: insulinase family protein [Clostridia bacterium]|nr:insulinase family protein [Clostridia bacterium]